MTGNQQNPNPQQNAPLPGFFAWVRGLGMVRGNERWLAGVCGAIAMRTGLDPIIIRGVAIVATIFGAPVLALYVIAWVVLPTAQNDIIAERILGGRVGAREVWAIIAVAVVVLGLFGGTVSIFTGFGWPWWDGGRGATVFGGIWAVLIIGSVIALVVWLSSRSGRGRGPGSDGRGADGRGADGQGADGQGVGGGSFGAGAGAGAGGFADASRTADAGQFGSDNPGAAGVADPGAASAAESAGPSDAASTASPTDASFADAGVSTPTAAGYATAPEYATYPGYTAPASTWTAPASAEPSSFTAPGGYGATAASPQPPFAPNPGAQRAAERAARRALSSPPASVVLIAVGIALLVGAGAGIGQYLASGGAESWFPAVFVAMAASVATAGLAILIMGMVGWRGRGVTAVAVLGCIALGVVAPMSAIPSVVTLGNVTVGATSASAETRAVGVIGGDAVIDANQFVTGSTIAVSAIGGDVTLRLAPTGQYRIELRTVGGRVSFAPGLSKDDINAHINTTTVFVVNGVVTSGLADRSSTTIRINAVGGDVHVSVAAAARTIEGTTNNG